MQVACFSSKSYDEQFLGDAASASAHEFRFLTPRLDAETAVLASGSEAICAFVNDQLDRTVLERLSHVGVRFIVLRCAGFNQLDVAAAAELSLRVARVPRYSPYAVAEHTAGLLLTLNRKIHKAYNRVRDQNFAIDGLLGFDLHGRTFGLIGTGAIGCVLAKIMSGFGCDVLLHDPFPNADAAQFGQYVELDELFRRSDLVSLQCPLTPKTHHLINAETIGKMKPGVIIINTSRGGLIDTAAAIDGLKSKRIGGLALDVYEEESGVFFEDLSQTVLHDDVLARLMTFPNVLVTSHQAFFTIEALQTIASTTIANLDAFARGGSTENEVAVASG